VIVAKQAFSCVIKKPCFKFCHEYSVIILSNTCFKSNSMHPWCLAKVFDLLLSVVK
jgi:hypothetical protein